MRVWTAVLLSLLIAGCASGNKRGEAYVKARPDIDPETKRRILSGEVVEGMSGEEVIAALGGPGSVRRIADGTEFWDYRAAVLVFKEGVLVNWVDKKTLY
jgi:hypothetical protein